MTFEVKLAIAAFCAAKGLTPSQSDRVWGYLEYNPVDQKQTVGDLQQIIDQAVFKVRNEDNVAVIEQNLKVYEEESRRSLKGD